MPYEILEKRYERLGASQQKAVVMFVDFLLMHPDETSFVAPGSDGGSVSGRASRQNTPRFGANRKLGGFEEGFYMADDFDAPIPDFAEYSLVRD